MFCTRIKLSKLSTSCGFKKLLEFYHISILRILILLTDALIVTGIVLLFVQLYEMSDDVKRKEFLDELFTFMQKRGELVTLTCDSVVN